jgi:hypothetical protein
MKLSVSLESAGLTVAQTKQCADKLLNTRSEGSKHFYQSGHEERARAVEGDE